MNKQRIKNPNNEKQSTQRQNMKKNEQIHKNLMHLTQDLHDNLFDKNKLPHQSIIETTMNIMLESIALTEQAPGSHEALHLRHQIPNLVCTCQISEQMPRTRTGLIFAKSNLNSRQLQAKPIHPRVCVPIGQAQLDA